MGNWFSDVWGKWGNSNKGVAPSGMMGRMNEMTNSWYHSLGGTLLYNTGIMSMLGSVTSIFGGSDHSTLLSRFMNWGSQFDPGTNYRYLVKPALISTFDRNLGNTTGLKHNNIETQKIDINSAFYGNVNRHKGISSTSGSDEQGIYTAHLSLENPNVVYDQTGSLNKKQNINDEKNGKKFPVIKSEDANKLKFYFPDWGYADFINERAIFQKSLYSGVGEKGWFYFKIFFNFDTQFGLLGGLLNDDSFYEATNSAARYLWLSSKLYPQELLNDRIVALHKFASILSFISSNAPWFFKSIKNLNTANTPKMIELTKEQSIEIEFNPDSIDMRVNTMFDLYKFACFDDIGQKEIIPENLRKFDMTVVMFEAPLRYLHTGAISKQYGKFNYKTLNPENSRYDNLMSFKMFHFINCEFDLTTLGNTIPSSMTNEQPFDTGNVSIKIKYDRVFTHTMNEFMEIMFGSDGIYYNTQEINNLRKINGKSSSDGESAIKHPSDLQDKRYLALQNALKNAYYVSTDSLPDLVDASEAVCHLGLKKFGGNSLGNILGGGEDSGVSHFTKYGKYVKNGIKSKYFNYKFCKMSGGNRQNEGDISVLVGSDKMYDDLKTYHENLIGELWNTHPNRRNNTDYIKEKIHNMRHRGDNNPKIDNIFFEWSPGPLTKPASKGAATGKPATTSSVSTGKS